MRTFTIFVSCSIFAVAMLYSYIDAQNGLTRLRLEIPILAAEVRGAAEENTRLQYEIDLFESPENLMKLATNNAFSHLKYPMSTEVVIIAQGCPLEKETPATLLESNRLFKTPLATGLSHLAQ